MTEDPLERFLKIKTMVVVAGFCGAVVSLAVMKNVSVRIAFFAVFTGISSAAFFTPVVQHFMQCPPPIENGIAFLLGLTGMVIAGKIYEFATKTEIGDIFRTLLTRKKDGGNDK